jgi:hypothetical protein
LIGAARIVRACRARHVQEVIFHSREADVAKRVIVVEVDRPAAREGTYAPAEPVKRSSNQVCHSRAPSFAGAQPQLRAAGLDLGGRERRIVKIPAIQFLPVANRRSPPPASSAGGRLDRDAIPGGDGHELANFRYVSRGGGS